jgi:hypothetical protein
VKRSTAIRHLVEVAEAAFDTDRYTNELGVEARADLLDDIVSELMSRGLDLVVWYGVRVFNDAVSADAAVPEGDDVRSYSKPRIRPAAEIPTAGSDRSSM